MVWDPTQIEGRLKHALDTFNWTEAEAVTTELRTQIRTEPEILPEPSARNVLYMLRRKRRFNLMTGLGDDLIQSGVSSSQVRKLYAQALIDSGLTAAAEMLLQSIVQDPQSSRGEALEARGLIGRIYKQRYVNNNDPRSARNRGNLEHALNDYLYAYRLAPEQNLWHGVNVVALVARARRDRQSITDLPDAVALSQEILAVLARRERQSDSPPPAFDVATKLEALVALGCDCEASDVALRYVDVSDADAFEINSTFRQLTEVWQLNEREAPGNHVLPILRAGYLKRQGSAEARDVTKVGDEAVAVSNAIKDLEKVFDADRMVTLKWYRKGLDQCSAVARIERRNGQGHGTGWLVDAATFFPTRTGVLLLTNAHVVSQHQSPVAILPTNSQANFQALGKVCEIEAVVWESPVQDLDTTFLSLKETPEVQPLSLHSLAAAMAEPPPRMYIIGHPGGRDLELSLQDNQLVDCNERFLHYRTPTEGGSSGSPVFEPEDWRVIALHHKGSAHLARLDGHGTYAANEGIAILAIKSATRGN